MSVIVLIIHLAILGISVIRSRGRRCHLIVVVADDLSMVLRRLWKRWDRGIIRFDVFSKEFHVSDTLSSRIGAGQDAVLDVEGAVHERYSAAARDPALLRWVAARATTARRIASTYMGTFVTAAAGLLDGRRAVTHWRWCDELRRRHPAVIVVPDRIYVEDGALWSSGGVTAGIDLALAMVEADLGRDVALSVARGLVVLLKRAGGQAQYGLNPDLPGPDSRFEALHNWLQRHLSGDLRVERLAEFAAMSPRSFARIYASVMKTTPARAVEAFRVDAARALLETGRLPLKAIADRCGFRTVDRLRHAFLRQFGVLPADYRAHFGPM